MSDLTRRRFLALAGGAALATSIPSMAEAASTTLVGVHCAQAKDSQHQEMENFRAWGKTQGKDPRILCSWISPKYTEWYGSRNLTELLNYNAVSPFDTALSLGSGLALTLTLWPTSGNLASLLHGGEVAGGDKLTFDEWCVVINAHARRWHQASGGKPLHFRLLHEPNHVHSPYYPFYPNGRRKAWWPGTIARLYARFSEIAIRGGKPADINRRLYVDPKIRQPGVKVRPNVLYDAGYTELAETGEIPRAAIWHQWAGVVPWGRDKKGNEFWRYFPRPRHVHTIGIDVYTAPSYLHSWLDSVCAFARKRKKRVSLPETGLLPVYGDNPDRAREVKRWIERHPEISFVGNFEVDKRNATTVDAQDWRISNRPKTLDVWKNMVSASRFRGA